jgi:hypothetical protein
MQGPSGLSGTELPVRFCLTIQASPDMASASGQLNWDSSSLAACHKPFVAQMALVLTNRSRNMKPTSFPGDLAVLKNTSWGCMVAPG